MLTIKLFLESIHETKSPDTVSGYQYDLIHFERFLKERINLEKDYDLDDLIIEQDLFKKLNQADIIAYLRYLDAIKNKKSTINRKISALKKYFLFLYENHIIENDITSQLKTYKLTKNKSNFLSIDQCNTLLNNISGRNTTRDQLIILLFLICGLTVYELISIKKCSIHTDYILINEGTENFRKSYINDALRSILSVFFRDKRDNTSKYLFSVKDGGHISKRTVQHIIKVHLTNNDFYQEGKTTELLKNTCFSLLSKYCGLDFIEIKKYLGYKNYNDKNVIYQKSHDRVNSTVLNKIPIAFKK